MDIPRYSTSWYRMLITNQHEILTQEHIDFYVNTLKLSISLYENEYEQDGSLKYYPKVSTYMIDDFIEKMFYERIPISQVTPIFKKIESASTDKERLQAYLLLHTIDDTIIHNVYSSAKREVDRSVEKTKRILDTIDRLHQHEHLIQEVNDCKFNLRNFIDQQPLEDPIKNVEAYIDAFEILYFSMIDDIVAEIDTAIALEERTAILLKQLHESKEKLLIAKEKLPYSSNTPYLIQKAFEQIDKYEQAIPIQSLKEVVDDAVVQYDKLLQMPLSEKDRVEVEKAKMYALDVLNNTYVLNQESSENYIQIISSKVQRLLDKLQPSL